jgi:hypothetical protein
MTVEPFFPLHIGRCVYCGDTSDLSDEHIIPLGLGGEWQLLKASCRRHRDLTSAFETQVLHRDLLALRTTLGLRTRRPRKRPTQLPLTLHSLQGETHVTLPVTAHPGGAAFPTFPPPSCLADGGSTENSKPGWVVRSHFPSLVALSKSYGATHYNETAVDRLAFARLLGKIAYCFAAGCLHPDSLFDSCLLPLIEGSNSDFSPWIGGSSGAPVHTAPEGHHVTLAIRPPGIVAYVSLLAELDLPEYTVVVRQEDMEWLSAAV